MERLRVVMAGGGTGGHLYPGLAVAGALEERVRGLGGEIEIWWAATPRAVDQRLLSAFGERYVKQAVQPLTKSVGKLWGFWWGWRESCRYWEGFMAKHRVDCVVALGGYAAGPAAFVAGKQGVPVVLLNPDALPGRANRFLLKRADVVVTQWALGEGYKQAVKGEVRVLGCPIRAELVGRTREEGARRLGVDAGLKTLVVTGASLGAKTINDAVLAMMEDGEVRGAFERDDVREQAGHAQGAPYPTEHGTRVADSPNGWQIIHLSGMEQAGEVRAGYAKWPGVRVKVIDYCDDMGSLWALTDIAIARAGASTCAELTACGVPSILLPYPFHADMHQRANALELEKVGAAAVVEDAKEARANATAIKGVLKTILYDEKRRQGMAAAARKIGKPKAADEIAGEILTLTGRSLR